MSLKVISKEKIKGKCNSCGDIVYDMAFVKDENKDFYYVCLDCANEGTSKREKKKREIKAIDEARLARKELLNILLEIAEDDEKIFRDPRLSVVDNFKDEIVEGKISDKLEKYIKFHNNDIDFVLTLRSIALLAKKREGDKYRELVRLYIDSRVRKLSEDKINRVKILMSDKDIQNLNVDYRIVWDNLINIKNEVDRYSSKKRYENIKAIQGILYFADRKGYLTDHQMRKLKSFYFEMVRRNKNKKVK